MSSNIVLIGRGPGWERDYEEVFFLFNDNFHVMAIGGNCLYEDSIDFMATYHERDIVPYFQNRKNKNQNTNYKVIHHEKRDHVDIVIPYEPPSGSSALLGCLASIQMGYKKIILCGCPLEGLNDKKSPYSMFRQGWKFHFNKVKDNVRSMSGWTQQLLGGPTEEWLKIQE